MEEDDVKNCEKGKNVKKKSKNQFVNDSRGFFRHIFCVFLCLLEKKVSGRSGSRECSICSWQWQEVERTFFIYPNQIFDIVNCVCVSAMSGKKGSTENSQKLS